MAKGANEKAASSRGPGARSLYKPEMALEAYNLSLLGKIDKEIALVFGVTEKTLNNWKKRHPELLQSLKRGKDIADGQVAASLFERAIGFSVKKIKWVTDKEGVESQVEYYEQLPPDPVSMIFWLKNRQPRLWRDKPEPINEESNATPVNVVIQVQDARKKGNDDE